MFLRDSTLVACCKLFTGRHSSRRKTCPASSPKRKSEAHMAESAASTQKTAIRHEFAEVNGVRLHYASVGARRLILFLHGFPEFWYAWKNQLAHFGRDFFAVAPDQRGYNLSSKTAEVRSYEVKFLVEDGRALARHLGHERFILVGHDWGGVVAWA